ncbi:MAG: very short patch repair endonuclease [Gallionella sp.]|nr:very short patch repair endonuclease [Gallionella sp.]
MSRIEPSSPEASRRMAKVRQKGTGSELAFRRELYRNGLRYRINFCVMKKPRRVADIAFPRLKIAIFIDGCFWHGCPEHATWPKQNAEFWRNKIETNRARDIDTDVRLDALGWKVVRMWEHESPVAAAESISDLVAKTKVECLKSSPNSNERN